MAGSPSPSGRGLGGQRSVRACSGVVPPPHLDGGFAGDVGNQEVHGDVFTVHVCVHPVLDVSRHLVRVQIVEVLRRDGQTVGPLARDTNQQEVTSMGVTVIQIQIKPLFNHHPNR